MESMANGTAERTGHQTNEKTQLSSTQTVAIKLLYDIF